MTEKEKLYLEVSQFIEKEYWPHFQNTVFFQKDFPQPEDEPIHYQSILPSEDGYEKDYEENSPDVLYQEVIPEEEIDLEPSFSEKLFHLIKEKNISEVECYKNANIDRKLFSKIRSNKDYHPNKKTAISLALSLKLNFEESKDLLETAGYHLSRSIKRDVIIAFCIKKGIYDIIQVNEILAEFKCDLLTS